MRRLTALMLLPILPWLILTPPATAAQSLEGRWWVVIGSSPAPESLPRPHPEADRAAEAARRCGMEPMGDYSAKFENFAPDLYVAVVGGFTTRAEAEAALARLRPCVPGAYLRRGGYGGE
ncbi:SPOR domain-containing protein [Pararoseomonas sp. SCSIO 73927]|uniref:SPOR domain-containing protein n=1 Tax=Pararoseomonas sp. SCSIO 73927 TaxID=3114537 RepID=UPI0030CCF1FA